MIFRDYGVAEAPPSFLYAFPGNQPLRVQLLITKNVFCIVQRATAQPKQEFFLILV
jgi:hypothetical protein